MQLREPELSSKLSTKTTSWYPSSSNREKLSVMVRMSQHANLSLSRAVRRTSTTFRKKTTWARSRTRSVIEICYKASHQPRIIKACPNSTQYPLLANSARVTDPSSSRQAQRSIIKAEVSRKKSPISVLQRLELTSCPFRSIRSHCSRKSNATTSYHLRWMNLERYVL